MKTNSTHTIRVLMQHALLPAQMAALRADFGPAYQVVGLPGADLLAVPDEPSLGPGWFVSRARLLLEGLGQGDVVVLGGQAQLMAALAAGAHAMRVTPIEAVSRRQSTEATGADGRVTKTSTFAFAGWRVVWAFTPADFGAVPTAN